MAYQMNNEEVSPSEKFRNKGGRFWKREGKKWRIAGLPSKEANKKSEKKKKKINQPPSQKRRKISNLHQRPRGRPEGKKLTLDSPKLSEQKLTGLRGRKKSIGRTKKEEKVNLPVNGNSHEKGKVTKKGAKEENC